MSKSDWEYFNCSEKHEHDYVVSLYKEKVTVSECLIAWCKDGVLKNTTHEKLYEMLANEGYTKIK